ncbi:class I SAM-dependent methyltransferase [Nocardia jejuensis]|uniref:class I SAM-dependent methyltransferase n=1 Tax=Nocardia jejuensis TaxID=328049 RepID=UPI000A0481D9|nr:class I SAM-dependent methyltransferase [Nocardia jejuensis]
MAAQTHEHSKDHAHSHGGNHSHGHGHSHTHDGIDWTTQIGNLRRGDALGAASAARIAERLIGALRKDEPTVLDIGAGAGGQSAAFARELARAGGGRLVIVDAVPELLEVARETAIAALDGDHGVRVEIVRADAAADGLGELVPEADLVWASRMVHHLPDQQAGTDSFARLLRPGGWLALSEGGLPTRCLPWDLGVGEPGLQDRLLTAWEGVFVAMREEITGAVRMPYGWTTTLRRAGLTEVASFSVLTDHPAPTSPEVREHVTSWLDAMRTRVEDVLSDSDRAAIDALLDPAADTYVGTRDDLFVLGASTIYIGRR